MGEQGFRRDGFTDVTANNVAPRSLQPETIATSRFADWDLRARCCRHKFGQHHREGSRDDRTATESFQPPGRRKAHTVSSPSNPTTANRLSVWSYQRPGQKTAHTAQSLTNLTATYLNDVVTGADESYDQRGFLARTEYDMLGLVWL